MGLPVGETLRAIRHERKMTLRYVGARAGLHFNTVLNIERGRCKPDLDDFTALCRALDVSPVKLYKSLTREVSQGLVQAEET